MSSNSPTRRGLVRVDPVLRSIIVAEARARSVNEVSRKYDLTKELVARVVADEPMRRGSALLVEARLRAVGFNPQSGAPAAA